MLTTTTLLDLSTGNSFFQCIFDFWVTNDTSFVEGAATMQTSLRSYIALINELVGNTPPTTPVPKTDSTPSAAAQLLIPTLGLIAIVLAALIYEL